MTVNSYYMHPHGCTHTTSLDTQKPSWLSPLSLSLLSMGGLKTMNHMKDVAALEMFSRVSLEKRAVC